MPIDWSKRRKYWKDREILWLLAAATLIGEEQDKAYADIAVMSGATWDQVLFKADRLKLAVRGSEGLSVNGSKTSRTLFVPTPTRTGRSGKEPYVKVFEGSGLE